MTKQTIIDALRAFLATRPGFDPGNYSDAASYLAEMRQATRQRKEAERFLRDIELRNSITAEDILREASGGRVEISIHENRDARATDNWTKTARVHYTAGQYYPLEYRGAVARLLASVLWNWKRDKCMPADQSADWLRASFRREYGRGLAARYFT